ncbi:hypothetical protein AOQ84DRAFT_424988 [Glonium stellatum]|uniref:ATP-dependent RNA helicase DHX8 n=1 Tax=Glonium stellatum TaxID=574774 RepID=A0A8E2ENK1_9PEZI|nr:hypothetical protein AOQ84DRAFT_424988 [Glonium stellatum]
MGSNASDSAPIPYRQIRASYNKDTITVYQAYSSTIALPAVKEQKLDASPDFRLSRMTWVKPSWAWMMYRSGYSYKDTRQAHILAIKMKHEHFLHMLSLAVLTHDISTVATSTELRGKDEHVKVQWDPERTPALGKLPYRSIQIGIPVALIEQWVDNWIVGIEDVTERARALKTALDENSNLTIEELIQRRLVPEERLYELSDDLQKVLHMSG